MQIDGSAYGSSKKFDARDVLHVQFLVAVKVVYTIAMHIYVYMTFAATLITLHVQQKSNIKLATTPK